MCKFMLILYLDNIQLNKKYMNKINYRMQKTRSVIFIVNFQLTSQAGAPVCVDQ